jgi:hypothetical protein
MRVRLPDHHHDRSWRSWVLLVLVPLFMTGLAACTSKTGPGSPSPGSHAGSSSARPTASAQQPYDLTKSPFFQTPDGNIKCGLPGFKWWPDQPGEPAPFNQTVDCRITRHTIPPANCANFHYEATPGVEMQPSEYASFTCVGMEQDQPMYGIETSGGGLKTRNPYHARADQDLNLGPATCLVGAASVDCASSDGKHRFHLDPDSFRSPLAPGDSVLAAENTGAVTTNASSGAVRPAKYEFGENVLSDVSWTTWNPDQATGSATYEFNTCQPQCAAGNFRTDHDVSIKFIDPKIVCGQWFFTHLSVADPADAEVNGALPIAPDTDAQGRQCLPPSNG